jgi:hypothetical protein
MNANLTISALTFTQTKSGDAGSERREVSRGVNLPEILTIKHSEYVDSATKLRGIRTLVRIDRYVAITDGRIVPVSFYCVAAVPADALITSADVVATKDRMVNLIHGATNTSGLDLGANLFVTKEQ